ncbi:hypothetical protein CNR33_00050 [Pseudomonas phage tabernarius]|uniref:Uncharacterized protein n=1 Tax=Pseudomonas phage tabernarius TaxID=2048978 RepID=A0A2H4P6U1_9CAUD|nr:tail fiber protein [Pseudomonas phage tabernarius]ATW57896.1 hypothetical protein CNR33_00050 [Pseudomonas phage tabernarius]
MPSILASILGKTTTSFLQTINDETLPVLKDLKVESSRITLKATLFSHKLENGQSFVDSKVMVPIVIEMTVICPTVDVVDELNSIILNRSARYQVTSRGLIFPNMLPKGETIDMSGEMLSATPIKLTWCQLLVQGEAPVLFANQAESRIVQKGTQLLDKAESTATELAGQAKQWLGIS